MEGQIMRRKDKSFLFVIICFFGFSTGLAQQSSADHDTSYYVTYRTMLTARAYLSRKYNVLSFDPPPPAESFQYRATTSLNLGIGATYHAFTLNIGSALLNSIRTRQKAIPGISTYKDISTRVNGILICWVNFIKAFILHLRVSLHRRVNLTM
jgi:hypothetical protein